MNGNTLWHDECKTTYEVHVTVKCSVVYDTLKIPPKKILHEQARLFPSQIEQVRITD